jgi:hypothetical protein
VELKIKFIGDDLGFYEEIKKRYENLYTSVKFSFSEFSIKKNSDSITVMQMIYEEQIDVIFIDFEDDPLFAYNFSLLVNSNAELRKKSLCALHGFNERDKSIDYALSAEVRINHIKGIEIHDIVFDTISFIDVDKSKVPAFVSGEDFDILNLEFKVKVCYCTPKYLHVETNTQLEEGQIVELSAHPLDHFIKSKRFRVINEKNSNLFYNSRFSYDLEFTYIDDQFFRSSEQAWLDSIEYEGNKKGYEQDTSEDFDQMLRLVKMRKNKIKYPKNELEEWVVKNKNESVKKTKVLIFDDSMHLIRETRKIKDTTIKYETGLVYDYYQIRRFNPHLVIFNITEKQSVEKANELLEHLSTLDEKILVCLTNTEDEFKYEKYITFPEDLDLKTFKTMITKFNSKIDISTNTERVFFDIESKNTFVSAKTSGEIVKLNESEIYFTSKMKIPEWTVFKVMKPISMLLTVVPHLANNELAKQPDCFRALVNATTELTKADLRVIINQSLVEEEETDEDSDSDNKSEPKDK